jgi:chlorite dismutase
MSTEAQRPGGGAAIPPTPPDAPALDLLEHGGHQQTSTRRLFAQLHAFGGVGDTKPLVAVLERSRAECVLYADANDPQGVAVLVLAEDPAVFTGLAREVLGSPPFSALTRKPEFTMLGRTYASGYETDLEDWLLKRPRRTVFNAEAPWAIWYPLRRTPSFARLSPREQGAILREHAALGRAYGEADLAHDVRLACHGLDRDDNDFVIGLVGRELYPLSHLVQAMRKTAQTSEYIQTLGPFLVGHAVWRSGRR